LPGGNGSRGAKNKRQPSSIAHTVQWLAGGVFGIALATLIPFLVEKGAAPRGHAVLWLLYGALGATAVAWSAATLLTRQRNRGPKSLSIIYTLDGSADLRVGLRSGRPQIALLEVALKNPNPFNLEGLAVNSLIPSGLRLYRCGIDGKERELGSWLTTPERLAAEPSPGAPKDYWADENLTVAGNGTKLLLFKLRITRPGRYFLKTLVFGNVPKQHEEAILDVVETEDMTIGATVGELINDGERLADGLTGRGLTDARWRDETAFLVGFLPEEDHRWWTDRTADSPQGVMEAERERNLLSARIPALYELRRRLSRPTQDE
jgi:hypothetical protein